MQAKTGKNKHRSHTVATAIKNVIKTKEKSINLNVPEKLHTEFKTKAASNNISMSKVLIEMINNYVEI